METNVIYNEDCIGKNGMCRLPDNNIDMILADLPYGTTACKWDSIIPLRPLWKQYKRVIKDNGAIVLTASQPFTTKLIQSNMEWFRYEWIWEKHKPSNFALANKRPMKYHENILVFYQKQPVYNPQMVDRKSDRIKQGIKNNYEGVSINKGELNSLKTIKRNFYKYNPDKKLPPSILKINAVQSNAKEKTNHPTQKPVSLFEYLIKTYTNKNEVVLDNVIGSGTTAIACLKTNRQFIGFEKEKEYYNITLKRIGRFDKSYYKELPEEEKPKQLQLF
ncbi:MAG: DNA-methyltransferase [bacterium]